MLSVSIENWSKIFKEISQGDISVPVSRLPSVIQQVVHSEFGDIESLSYGTWLEVFARLDTNKEGVLDISGFSKFAARGDKGGKKTRIKTDSSAKVDSGVKSREQLTKADKEWMESEENKDKSKREIREGLKERRQERKTKKEQERESKKNTKELVDDKAKEEAKVRDDDGEGDLERKGNKKYGKILNYVITELFNRISGNRKLKSPFRDKMQVSYTTVLNNYTPVKLDSQEKALEASVEESEQKLNEMGADTEEGKKYSKYVERAKNQKAAFIKGRPMAEAHLKKVIRAKQRFYEKMAESERVEAIADRYSKVYKEKRSEGRKKDREQDIREQQGRVDTKFLNRLIDASIDNKDISGMKPKADKKASADLTHAQAQALVDLYSFKVRLAKLRGEPTQDYTKALTLAKAAKGLMLKEAAKRGNKNKGKKKTPNAERDRKSRSDLSETLGEAMSERSGFAELGLNLGGKEAIQDIYDAMKGKSSDTKDAIIDAARSAGLKTTRNGWDYDPAYWEEVTNRDQTVEYLPYRERFNDDGTINPDWNSEEAGEPEKEEEEPQDEAKPKGSYKDLIREFTKIFLKAVEEEVKSNTPKLPHPYKKDRNKMISWRQFFSYASQAYWNKEIEKAKKRQSEHDYKARKSIEEITDEYNKKRDDSQKMYKKVLIMLAEQRTTLAKDTRWVYELAKSEMRLPSAKEDYQKEWSRAGLVAGIQKKYGEMSKRTATEVGEELSLNIEPNKDKDKKKKSKSKPKSTGGDAPQLAEGIAI